MPSKLFLFRFCSRQFHLISFLFFIAFSSILSGCQINRNQSTKKSTSIDKQITISGSTTILPLCEHWAMEFRKKTGTIVNVQGGGSTNGIVSVKNQTVDIGASSRNLSESEKEGVKIIEIGLDALAVVVNPKNKISNLSTKQLGQIFSGQIKNWKELGGDDRAIQVINREAGSGTRSTFEDLIMCANKNTDKNNGKCYEMHLSAIVLNSNSEVKHSIELIEDSIGYISYGFLDQKVKALSLNSTSPGEEAIRSGNYPISRSLYYIVREGNESVSTAQYLQFVLSSEAQQMLSSEGFLPGQN
jgi:phosphate transport system substrate-binding protein